MTNAFDEQWPELASLLGAYFHQDFIDLYGSPDATVAAFVAEAVPGDVDAAAEQARALATSRADEDELRTIVDQLGSYYAYWVDGWTCRGWLEHVAARLSSSGPRM